MNSTPHLHQSGDRTYLRGIAFLLLFSGTAAATYYMEKRFLREEATFTATAVVSWSAANSGQRQSTPQTNAFCLDSAGVEEEIRSVPVIATALDHLAEPHDGLPDPMAIEDRAAKVNQIRKKLQVLVFEMPPGEFRVIISYADSTAERAMRLVNGLAQQFVGQRRTKSEQVARKRWSATDKAMAQAWDRFARNRQMLAQAETQLSSALAEYVPLHRAGVAAMERHRRDLTTWVSEFESPPASVERTIPDVQRSTCDDPSRVALQGELRALENRLSELLLTRTASHPDVQEVQAQVIAARERLKAIVQLAPPIPPLPVQRPVAVKRPPPPPSTDMRAEEALARVLAEKRSLDEAAEELGRIAPPQAWNANEFFPIPRLDCRLAEEAQSQAGEHPELVWLITAAVALTVTGGIGTITTGVSRRAPGPQQNPASIRRDGLTPHSAHSRPLRAYEKMGTGSELLGENGKKQ